MPLAVKVAVIVVSSLPCFVLRLDLESRSRENDCCAGLFDLTGTLPYLIEYFKLLLCT